MNTAVLNQYKIKFEIVNADGGKQVSASSGIIPYFRGYFIKLYPEFLTGEIIPEINKAIAGHSFDPDAGGEIDFLTIGHTTSYFSNISNNQYTIPTVDLKE